MTLSALTLVLLIEASDSETVVTGTRTPRSVEDAPIQTLVISRAEIERSPTLFTDELVRTSTLVQTFRASSSITAGLPSTFCTAAKSSTPLPMLRRTDASTTASAGSARVLRSSSNDALSTRTCSISVTTYLVGRAGIDTVGPPFSFRAGFTLRTDAH